VPRPIRPAAWIHGSLGFGGGERVLIEQVRALAPRGNPVDVFTVGMPGPQDLVDAVRAANPHVRDVGRLDGSGDIARTLARRGYEAVFTCWSTRAYRGIERLRQRPFARRPVVLETVHERYGWCFRDHEDRRREQVDFWLATYDFVGGLRRAFDLPADRVAVTRPLFPALLPPARAHDAGRALRRTLGIPDDAVVVGYAGRLSGNKGLHDVVPAVARIAARGADVHLLLAGRIAPPSPAYEARLGAAVAAATTGPDAPLRGRLHLVGPLPDVHPVYAAADVVPLLSSMEGLFPLMLVEAMAHGVAVVTTDVGGIGTCLRDGVDAAVVRKLPDDELDATPAVVAAFEARLERLVVDAAERRRLGDAGRARVHALVAANDFHGDTLRAYERALALGRLRR